MRGGFLSLTNEEGNSDQALGMSVRAHHCRQPLKHISAPSSALKEAGSFLGASLLFLLDLMVLVRGFV